LERRKRRRQGGRRLSNQLEVDKELRWVDQASFIQISLKEEAS